MRGLRLNSRPADQVTTPARRQPALAAGESESARDPVREHVRTQAPAPTALPEPVRPPDPDPDRAPESDPGAVAVVGLGLALPGANNTSISPCRGIEMGVRRPGRGA